MEKARQRTINKRKTNGVASSTVSVAGLFVSIRAVLT
jgi:hypothetical protein